VTVQASLGVTVEGTVLWRSMLPAFQIIGGALTLGGAGLPHAPPTTCLKHIFHTDLVKVLNAKNLF
jgi:hypothetical protein